MNLKTALICLAAFASAGVPAQASPTQLHFQFQIHPDLKGKPCFSLPTERALEGETEFKKLLKKGWVEILDADYQAQRKFYPCQQDVAVTFPHPGDFYAFLRQAGPSPEYPFFSGADYGLMRTIFEGVSQSGDEKAYRLLLLKDTSASASELDAPLYAKLRKNPTAFLAAFRKLTDKEQETAVRTQYDFNDPISAQLFSISGKVADDAKLREAAMRFNRLMRKIGKQQSGQPSF